MWGGEISNSVPRNAGARKALRDRGPLRNVLHLLFPMNKFLRYMIAYFQSDQNNTLLL